MMMITDERQQQLKRLLQQAIIADDTYYYKMDNNNFNKLMATHRQESFYHDYAYQRAVGYDNYQQEMIQEMQKIHSAVELHFMARDYNFDSGTFALEQILFNPACHILTAQMIYWRLEPEYYYNKFKDIRNSDNGFNNITIQLIIKIEDKAKSDGFIHGKSPEMDNQNLLSMQQDVFATFAQPGNFMQFIRQYPAIPSQLHIKKLI